MSGPKTSRYTLTKEQRRILEEKIREQREIAVLNKKKEGFIRENKELLKKTALVLQEMKKVCAESGMMTEEYDLLLQRAKEISEKLTKEEEFTSRSTKDGLINSNKELERMRNSILELLSDCENKTEKLKIELCKKIVEDSFEEVSFTERDNKEFLTETKTGSKTEGDDGK